MKINAEEIFKMRKSTCCDQGQTVWRQDVRLSFKRQNLSFLKQGRGSIAHDNWLLINILNLLTCTFILKICAKYCLDLSQELNVEIPKLYVFHIILVMCQKWFIDNTHTHTHTHTHTQSWFIVEYSTECVLFLGVSVEPHRKQLHISLLYQFPTQHKERVENLAKSINLGSPVRWDLRLYSRDSRYAKHQVIMGCLCQILSLWYFYESEWWRM